MDANKSLIIENIEGIKNDLIDLSNKIHNNPELCFKEYKAVNWLIELAEKHDFKIENPCGSLETAFKARYRNKKEGPTVAFLAEYDALRGKGHACGHNIIAACAAGAAIGLSKVIDQIGGEVVLLGTPAEEGGGGKIILINEGAFDDIDFALMIHPGSQNLIGRGGLAAMLLEIEFEGKAAHSSDPASGINALKGLLEVFKGIDTLRSIFEDGTRVNGIITEGGEASNIIPNYAAGEFTLRAKTREHLKSLYDKIENLTEASKKVIGANPSIKKSMIYAERYPNMTIAEKFKKNMSYFGEEFNYPNPDMKLGSSDIGNVSMELPVIHSYLKIVEPNINAHTQEFAAAAKSSRAEEVIIKTSKGLAMTGYDILSDENLSFKILEEFEEKVKGGDNEF